MKKLLILIIIFYIQTVASQEKLKKYDEYYSPTTLKDAFAYMEYTWSEKDKEEFKNRPENKIAAYRPSKVTSSKMGWIYSPKIDILSKNGIYSIEDVYVIILKAFHRKLNNKKINFTKLIKPYKIYWRKIHKINLSETRTIYREFRVGDTLTFKYLRTFIDDEQEKLYYEGKCKAKGILLEKRKSDFNLKIKLIEICDEKGIYIIDFSKRDDDDGVAFEIVRNDDIFWNFYNDWEPKEKKRYNNSYRKQLTRGHNK